MNYLKLTLIILLFLSGTSIYGQYDVAPPPPPPSKKNIKKVVLPNNIKFISLSDDVGKPYENRIKKELIKIFNDEKVNVEFYLTDYPVAVPSSKLSDDKTQIKKEYEPFINERIAENKNAVIVHLHYRGINYDKKMCQVSLGENIASDKIKELEKLNICDRIKAVRW